MNKSLLLKKTQKYVKNVMQHDATGHDWFHILRVVHMAKYIAQEEKNADVFIIELAALLHDIADWKFTNSSLPEENILDKSMSELLLPLEIKETIKDIILSVSFRNNLEKKKKLSIEGQIVQDADRLDALGAIGIARAFAYGGKKGRQLYNPDRKPKKFRSANEYKNSDGTTINHFYEKLLLLKDLINTKTAKKNAAKREVFMKKFLEEFYDEWKGEK